MKRFFNISALALLLMGLALTSCLKHEEDDIFPNSAAERLENSIADYSDILTQKGGKWELQYFTTDKEKGYVYLFTFNKDGSVVISGQNDYIGKVKSGSPDSHDIVFGSEKSLWEVIADNGPVLSLNSYNSIFHGFADPAPLDNFGDRGEGHLGDYEFDIMKYSGDTLYLQGKKHGIRMMMTRLSSELDDRAYMGEVVAATDSFFHAKISKSYINLPSGYRYVIKNGASMVMDIYPETGDSVMAVSHNALITHDGFSFMRPIEMHDSIGGKDYKVQHFVRQIDGTLLCTDDGKTTINAGHLSDVLLNPNNSWSFRWGVSTTGGVFNTLSDQMAAELKQFRTTTLKDMYWAYNAAEKRYELYSYISFKRKNRVVTQTLPMLLDVERVSDDAVRLKVNLSDPVYDDLENHGNFVNAKAYYDNVAAYRAVIDKISATTFALTAPNLLTPLDVRLADAAQAGDYVMCRIR